MMRLVTIAMLLNAVSVQPERARAAVPVFTSIVGQVVDPAGPVAGADIRVLSERAGTERGPVAMVRSDQAGQFVIHGVAPGIWMLDVRHIGHAPHVQRITVDAQDTLRVHIVLRVTAQQLDTIAVQSNGVPARYGTLSRMNTFYERRARGRGQFFTREQLDERMNQRFHEFLATTRGARVRKEADGSVRVTFARCSGPARLDTQNGSVLAIASGANQQETPTAVLFIDGHRMNEVQSRQIIGELGLADIEAVEVYSGPSELPMDAMGSACAAIYVWTRFGPGRPPK